MFCKNCGSLLDDGTEICPNCNTIDSDSNNNFETANKYEEFQENEERLKDFNFNKYLVYSILEFFCCFQVIGVISLVLLFVKVKPSIEQKRFEEAEKYKNIVKILLIVGLFVGIGANLLYIVGSFLPVILAVFESLA